jgi:hypothetical protein
MPAPKLLWFNTGVLILSSVALQYAQVAACQCRFNFPHLCRSKIPQLAGCGDQPAV